jgi:hypothetical protein
MRRRDRDGIKRTESREGVSRRNVTQGFSQVRYFDAWRLPGEDRAVRAVHWGAFRLSPSSRPRPASVPGQPPSFVTPAEDER